MVGIITNHSWLDNPTFRGMRQSLMRSFEQIYVLDLHGNAKKKERAPDGSIDENVFDIEQGVAISLFVKRPGLERGVWRGDLWGKRLAKYQTAADAELREVPLSKLEPNGRDRLFIVQDSRRANSYAVGWPLNKIFPENGAGIVTAHDAFSIGFTHLEVQARFENCRRAAGNATELHREFHVARDGKLYQEAGNLLPAIFALLFMRRLMSDRVSMKTRLSGELSAALWTRLTTQILCY
ncbi:MAG TPA: hypothetical protein VJY34_08355 [Roseiarcus sp.]|nr:hypothetical protein [Roseiarcus sp.]